MDDTTSRSLREQLADLDETRRAVESAENRARLDQKTDTKISQRNNREYAQALHREADQLYRSGDYETALVLYYRAANLYPKDSSHGVAARKTAATISSCNNPKALRKVLPNSATGERLTAALCPETAAIMANEKLKRSPNPTSVAEALSYFDNHKGYWKSLPSARISNRQLARSKMILEQLNKLAESSLKDLQAAFDAGKMTVALKLAQELQLLSGGFQDPMRYQISAYHYLSLIHVALRRHDRAVCSVSRLVRLSKSTEDVVQICRSFVTLGKVHLSFGHLNAVAKAWENLSKSLKAAIPVAWIKHEIGRCYLETGKYGRAIEFAFKCVEAAIKGGSKKWMLNGRLLLGQSLANMGRFEESLEELQIAAKITEEEGDTPMLSYIRDLIEQVAQALTKIPYQSGPCWESEPRMPTSQREDKVEQRLIEETVTTSIYTGRRLSVVQDDEESLATDGGDTTIRSTKTISLVQSCRESTARSDLGAEEDEEGQDGTAEGSSTFRVKESPVKRDTRSPSPASSLASSSSTASSRLSNADARTKEAKPIVPALIDEKGETRESHSLASLKSVSTTATYIIETKSPGCESCHTKRSIHEEDESIEEIVTSRSTVYEDKMATPKEGMLTALRMIKELNQKDELLEMLRDMVLTTDAAGRPTDCGNAGDGFRSSRSDDDKPNEIGTHRSSRRTSLPSTARRCDAHGDFGDSDAPLKVD